MASILDVSHFLESNGFEYDDRVCLYVNSKTGLPVTLFFDREDGRLFLLDQCKLPYEVTFWSTDDWYEAAVKGIKGMIVRGSQAIGVAGAYCLALACVKLNGLDLDEALKTLFMRGDIIKSVRPTAVNLSWAINRIFNKIKSWEISSLEDLKMNVLDEADRIFIEDFILNKNLRMNGSKLFESGDVVLTHCNAGSLATSYGGSALSILSEAFLEGKHLTVVAKETRPRSQGFKLTLWELNRIGIPTVAITDNMISKSIEQFNISKILVGADRITKDGCVANKIGTCDIARIAYMEKIPFYVAASHSTLDLDREYTEIPIEERDKDEVRALYEYEIKYMRDKGLLSERAFDKWPPDDKLTDSNQPSNFKIKIYNPAFDVTPSNYIRKIILDIGVYHPKRIKLLNWSLVDEKINRILGNQLDKIHRFQI
ncbi:MAG: S-methyl-5-thioribose-1-phosphate isomerase [Candidatus Odinarchaeum yellowstonii]|uniref:S-methyl-5-thioribose-1-phosphate isomerase n=1 Tax=Odinarchaeota yellowstonii (strain LCB_4) TaxID=1841599 RepID=A0AAF0IC37_ODILC|nr:MAG: S-methyl-5-thioribose-1-phosphate isomerase [Candidatus Odinarchaeum yellowstonii]